MRVAIGIITYLRPDGLLRVLESLQGLVLADEIEVWIVVVDNDSQRSAESLCATIQSRWPVKYVAEPQRGIPFARNRVIGEAIESAEYVAFIDDDEEAEPQWLGELIKTCQRFQADVSTGPVLPRFTVAPPSWATRGRFFERPRYPTGTLRDRAFTGNVLFGRHVLTAMAADEGWFDERMALTGGSDSLFSQRIHRAGFKIVWSDEAVVHEAVPESRMTKKWVRQRAYRVGTTIGFIERDIRPGVITNAYLIADSGYRVLLGVAKWVLGIVVGDHMRLSGLRQLHYAAGLAVVLFGGKYDEYRNVH